jgi:hypothetical protein
MTDFRYSADELNKLADLVAEKVIERLPKHVCVFSADDQGFVRASAAVARNVRKTALSTTVGALVLGALAFIGAAVIEWGKKQFRNPGTLTP